MRQSWIRISSSSDAQLFDEFRADLALMLDVFRLTEALVDRSGSEDSGRCIVLRPAVGLDSGLFEWPMFISADELDRGEGWARMRADGDLGQDEGSYSVATNGSPFTAVVCGALIRAKHIYGDTLSVTADASWGEHWDREGTAVHAAREWVQTVFGVAEIPTGGRV